MRIGYILLLILCITRFSSAQQYNFQKFGVEQGLPQNTVYDIFQDSRGYLWFGTAGGGLARFDGKNFRVYNQKNGLADNVVRKITEDSKGKLWIATEGGISIFDGHNFTTIDTTKGLTSNIIKSLVVDDNTIWAGSSGGGLYHITPVAADSFNVAVFDINSHLSSNNIFDIYKDKFQKLWIATFGGGINVLSFNHDSITDIKYLNTNNFLPSDRLWNFEVEKDSILWVSTYDNGAFSINLSSDLENPDIKLFNTSNYLNDYRIWSILPGKRVWFATDKGGINRVDNKGQVNFFTIRNGLAKNQVYKIFKDNEGSVWFSLSEEGVYRFMGEQFYHITNKEGLLVDDINSICELPDGKIILATDGDGVYEVSDIPNLEIKKTKWSRQIPVNSFTDVVTDKKQDIWLSSEMGVFRYNAGKITFFTENKGMINNRVNCLLCEQNQTIWCGTSDGISKIINDKIYNARLGSGLINEIQTMAEDNEENVWCGTLNGLVKFHNTHDGGKPEVTTFDEVEGLDVKKINSLVVDKSNNIWIGTFGGGIYILQTKSQAPKPIFKFAGDSILLSNNINLLAFANKNTLLAGTDKGLCKIEFNDSLKVEHVFHYDNTNGYTGIESNKNSVAKIKNKFWIGNSKGITVFDPKADTVHSKLPKVHITDFKVNFEETNWAKMEHSLSWFNLPENLELTYKDNNLVISFIGLYYRNPEKVFYKYRLLGLSETWSKPTQDNEAQYLGLQPGEYTFEVLASNELSEWTQTPATFNFEINPPFWKTTLFYILCSLFLAGLVISYIKYRERQLKQDKIKLEAIVAERTCEVLAQKKQIEDKNFQITSSIKYAQRIQDALLPTEDVLKNLTSEYFIFYKPRDIVSGDFYWMYALDNKLIVTVADCTGHGVPGAFMSMLGISYLNEIIGKNKITNTSDILNRLRNNVIDALKQRGEIGGSKDGMDLAICTIDFSTKKLQYSGAMNPLIHIRNSELTELKADKMPIGYYESMKPFKPIEITIEKNDTIYMFSDGYIDQFGGTEGKKFMKKHFKNMLTEISVLSLNKQKEILTERMEEWRGEFAQIDDIVVVGFKI